MVAQKEKGAGGDARKWPKKKKNHPKKQNKTKTLQPSQTTGIRQGA